MKSSRMWNRTTFLSVLIATLLSISIVEIECTNLNTIQSALKTTPSREQLHNIVDTDKDNIVEVVPEKKLTLRRKRILNSDSR